MTDKVFALTPAQNAGGVIEQLFTRIPAPARQRIKRHIVVDDGSMDDTQEALDRLRLHYPDIVTLRHPTARGHGAAMKTLFACSIRLGADAVFVLPADLRFSAAVVPDILAPIDEGAADLVVGARSRRGRPEEAELTFGRQWAGRMLTAIENQAFGLKLADFHSGYIAYSRSAITGIPFQHLSDSCNFDLETIVMARMRGLRIKEVSIPYLPTWPTARNGSSRAVTVLCMHLRGAYKSL